MAKDFEQIGHKNLELLRFYVSKDLKRIDDKMQDNGTNLVGYFLGSLIDILVVLLFDDVFERFLDQYVSCLGLQILCKVLILLLFIGLFVFVAWTTRTICVWYHKKNDVSGRSRYVMDAKKQEMIDDFDNIACDGLLICQSYIQRYDSVQEDHIKNFYLFEIIHHLSKAADIFDEVYHHQSLYISSNSSQLLDSYRVDNFIVFAKEIIVFLRSKIPENSGNTELDIDMTNLEQLINQWN